MSYTLTCQNPACGRTFESVVPWAKYCHNKACQKYKVAVNTSNQWKRDHPPHPCKGGCGTLLTGKWLWCDKPECRRKQAVDYAVKLCERRRTGPKRNVVRKPDEKVVAIMDSQERKHNRLCKNPACGKPCWPNYFYCKKCSKPSDIVEEWLHAGFGHDFRRTGFRRGGAI